MYDYIHVGKLALLTKCMMLRNAAYLSVQYVCVYICNAGHRSHSMHNVLKTNSGRSGGGSEKGKVRKKEGEKDGSGKRKRSALEEIREVLHMYTHKQLYMYVLYYVYVHCTYMYTLYMYMYIVCMICVQYEYKKNINTSTLPLPYPTFISNECRVG